MDIAMNKIDIYIFDERLHSSSLEHIQYSIYKQGHTNVHTAEKPLPSGEIQVNLRISKLS